MAEFFNRKYKLLLDKPKEGGLQIEELRISFKVTKSLVGFPNLAEISIYNLKKEHRDKFKKDSIVKLFAGYEGNIPLIFKGEIKNFNSEYIKPDWITKVYAGDAQKAITDSTVNKTLGKGATTETIFEELLSNMKGVSKGVTDGLKDCITKKKSILKSIILSGSVKEWLDKIAETCGFDYSVNDGVIETVAKNKAIDDTPPYEVNQNNGLIGSPELTEIGADITVFLKGDIKLGRTFKVKSISEKINVGNMMFRKIDKTTDNKKYRINTIEHIGDTHSNDWKTTLEGMQV